jgi:hypothetical protein
MKFFDKISTVPLFILIFSSLGYTGLGQKIGVDDYKIQVFAEQNGERLEVNGQLTGGRSCAALLLHMVCTNQHGEEEEVNVIVKDITGAGSRLFRTETKIRDEAYEDWSISEVYAWCGTGKSVSVREYPSKIFIYGEGNNSPGYLNLRKGLNTFSFSHIGSKHFAVLLKNKSGGVIELIANLIGKKKGTNSVPLKYNGEYYIEVDASPKALWSIHIDYPSGKVRSIKTKTDTKQLKLPASMPKRKIGSPPAASNKPLKIREDEKGLIHIGPKEEDLKIWEDEEGVIHIEQ